jgi:hypothetical protein
LGQWLSFRLNITGTIESNSWRRDGEEKSCRFRQREYLWNDEEVDKVGHLCAWGVKPAYIANPVAGTTNSSRKIDSTFSLISQKRTSWFFLKWIPDVYSRVRKRSSLHEYWRLWKMLYRKSIGISVHAKVAEEVNRRAILGALTQSPATHIIPQAFDLRPSTLIAPPSSPIMGLPDELMIDWRNTPARSTVTIYWPQLAANDVVGLRGQEVGTNDVVQATMSDDGWSEDEEIVSSD